MQPSWWKTIFRLPLSQKLRSDFSENFGGVKDILYIFFLPSLLFVSSLREKKRLHSVTTHCLKSHTMKNSPCSLFCVWTRLKSAASAELVSYSFTALKYSHFPTVLKNGMSVSYSQCASIPSRYTGTSLQTRWALLLVIIIHRGLQKAAGSSFLGSIHL